MFRRPVVLVSIALSVAATALSQQAVPATASDLSDALANIRAVGHDGRGHVVAMDAFREVVHADAAQIPEILAGFQDAGPLAQNWLRSAVDTIAQRQLDCGGGLPKSELEKFIRARQNPPRARSLAFEWLCRVAPADREPLLTTMLDDPSPELRRDAVALAVKTAAQIDTEKERPRAVESYLRVLTAARDIDQVNLLAKRLTELGDKVDVPRHFGFVLDWRVIGPFHNTDRRGYHEAFGPEEQLTADASYEGAFGQVGWQAYHSTGRLGTVDFNEALGTRKQVTGYAWAQLEAPQPIEVDFRWTSRNASKVWLNGKVLAENEVYHSGASFDQYRVRGQLKRGENHLLVKVCQNEQTQDWTKNWNVQLRMCDELGAPLPSVIVKRTED